jgi:hypothetical protein
MPQAEWDALQSEVRELTRRVAQLEAHIGLMGEVSEAPAAELHEQSRAATDASSLVPAAGRALLGLAGAYLLRSLTESGNISPRAGAAAGILYAMAWLVAAARTPATRRLETAVHGLTAVLILSPLLWEATLNLHAISTWTAAAMLIAFGVFGLAVSWRKNLSSVATIVTLAVLGTSAALMLVTHDIPPFTSVFLAIAAAVEVSACLEHWLQERWLAAAAADLSVLLATWLVTNPHGLPEIYALISHRWLICALVALLTVYLFSTIVRTLFLGLAFTGFEIAQSAVAFAIVLNGALRLSATDPRLAPAIGTLALAGGAACYLVSFLRLDRRVASSRNFYTYSTFAILLALAGSRVLFSGSANILWYALAVASAGAGRFFGRMTLAVHAAAFLLLALATSGAVQEAGALLLGTAPWAGFGPPVLWLGAIAAILTYAITGRSFQAVRLTLAASAAGACAGIAAGCLTAAYHYIFGAAASHAYCATLRTTVLAGLSLLLAWAASRWKYAEFSRLIYPVMILGAYRLLVQDLHEEKAALFLSLLVYGAALTALPRLRKAGIAAPGV